MTINGSCIFVYGKFHSPFPPVHIKLYETSQQKPWFSRGLTQWDHAMGVLGFQHKLMTSSALLSGNQLVSSPEML